MLGDITSYFVYNPDAEVCYTSRPRLNSRFTFRYLLTGLHSLVVESDRLVTF